MWCSLRAWPKAETRAVLQPFNVAVLALAGAALVANGEVTASAIAVRGQAEGAAAHLLGEVRRNDEHEIVAPHVAEESLALADDAQHRVQRLGGEEQDVVAGAAALGFFVGALTGRRR